MSEPLREQVLSAIVTLLRATLTGDRPGADGTPWGQYPTDPIVTRGYKDPEQVNEMPALFITRRPGSSVKEKETAGGGVLVEHLFLLSIYGYTQTRDNVLASTWLERLWDDVYTVLMANWTLGGVCQQLTFDSEDDFDEDDVRAGFRMDLTAILKESKAIGA